MVTTTRSVPGLVVLGAGDRSAPGGPGGGLAPGNPELTTIAVSVRGGGFVVGDSVGAAEPMGGRQLAAALAGTPLYGGEARMWLRWPDDARERETLRQNLVALAASTGVAVWAPEPGAGAVVLSSCGDLGAVGPAGEPATWQVYLPPEAGPTRFRSDQDGRLSPVGAAGVTTYPGVPLVSVPAERLRAMAAYYTRLREQRGLFRVDLTLLDDGRWAAQHAGTAPHALGPRTLERALRDAGWRGEDLVLLASYPEPVAEGLRRYGSPLVRRLRAGVWMLPPEARLATADGAPRAVDRAGRPVHWMRLDAQGPASVWRSHDGLLVENRQPPATEMRRPVDRRPPATGAQRPGHRPPPAAGVLRPEERRRADEPPPQPAPAIVAATWPDLPSAPPPELVTARRGPVHGIYWITDRPNVNAEPVDLYVRCDCPPSRAVDDGVPTPHLFLLGTLAPPTPEELGNDQHLLRVQVAPGGAVDLSSINVQEPPVVQALLSGRSGVYLLPGGLLDRTSLSAGHAVAASGRLVQTDPLPVGRALRLRCAGAEHGIDGLPGDLPRWPWETEALAWALLPEDGTGPTVGAGSGAVGKLLASGAGDSGMGGALVLSRKRPRLRAGYRLIRLSVPWRRAIDIGATAEQIGELTTIRSALPDMLAADIELVLPRDEFDDVEVVRVLTAGRFGWRPVNGESARPGGPTGETPRDRRPDASDPAGVSGPHSGSC
ncbi:hypothetical protein HCA58_14025 [Micromonospora sp. HNM0581]|uniref:hypothetical protein n=1 Tax=Micromonospora sp. HNM0581 TaxID=2716341 RepID=UPI00146DD95E|nr:hypothetical protein [Micromonospora sp. HNM0581]NLU79479.1 hypothetical protein [Micromonospora sp. HNM0581]